MSRTTWAIPLALLAVSLLTPAARSAPPGSDWPTFLGPTQDGVSPEKGITPWLKEGLRKIWECELGIGFAPPVVAGGRLFHFDRFDDDCRLTCRDAATGKFLWKYEYPTAYEDRYGYDPGPRACPMVDGDRVYVYGPEGVLACVQVSDGQELWKINTVAKYHVHQNFFGVGSVPVIDGDLLIVPVGGSPKGPRPFDFRDAKPNGTAIVAFDKRTGEQKYAVGDELSSYSSPVIRTINGKKTGLYFARGGLFGFDPQTGKKRFHFPWRARVEESVNAANPVVIGDKIFLSECYGPGSALLDLSSGEPKVVWSDADVGRVDKALMCHWNTPIHHAGFVYGCSGRHDNEADVRCVDLAGGEDKVKWTMRRTFRSTLLMVDGYFVCLSEYCDLSLLRVNPLKCDEVSHYKLKELDFPCWAPPVLSHGILYVRGKGKLLALELIPGKG
jgi:outer membrane protein assembly factor BamB